YRFGVRFVFKSAWRKGQHEVAGTYGATEADIAPPAQGVFTTFKLASRLVVQIRVERAAVNALQWRGDGVGLIRRQVEVAGSPLPDVANQLINPADAGAGGEFAHRH